MSNEIIGRLIGNKHGAGFFPEREAIELCADLNGEIELVRKSSLDTALARIKELEARLEPYIWLRDRLNENDALAYECVEFAYRGGLEECIADARKSEASRHRGE